MTNETFDALPPRARLAFVLGTAARLFGREAVARAYRAIRPPIDDLVAHGSVLRAGSAAEIPDPADNYWGGAWQVYDAE